MSLKFAIFKFCSASSRLFARNRAQNIAQIISNANWLEKFNSPTLKRYSTVLFRTMITG